MTGPGVLGAQASKGAVASAARRAASVAIALLLGAPLAASCVSVGEGEGAVRSEHLIATDCWDDPFDLQPNFFAADPFRNQMHIRVQRGSDLLEVSDSLVLLIDDVEQVRQHLGEPIEVSLPAGVAPPGVPVGEACGAPTCVTTPVHAALYLLDSCHSQNTVLYGISGTVEFDELFSGDPNEDDAAEKLTVGHFDLMVGDPTALILEGEGAGTIPDQSQITGRFRFFFQRGQPAQPFP